MKFCATHRSSAPLQRFGSALLAAAALAIGSLSLQAAVLPARSNPYGKTYEAWATGFWQWALSIPADRNPLADATGEFIAEGQKGPVWYLPGTFGSSVARSYTIPAGKSLFMPVFNWIFGSGVFDCEPTVPGVPCNVPYLQALAAANTEAAQILEVSIDGEPVPNIRGYRVGPTQPFSITYPENSVVGAAAGTYFPQVADGYWLMIAPLAKGHHTIVVSVAAPGTIFGLIDFTVIHDITVQ